MQIRLDQAIIPAVKKKAAQTQRSVVRFVNITVAESLGINASKLTAPKTTK